MYTNVIIYIYMSIAVDNDDNLWSSTSARIFTQCGQVRFSKARKVEAMPSVGSSRKTIDGLVLKMGDLESTYCYLIEIYIYRKVL